MKISTDIKCFVVVNASALCGFLCWIEVLGDTLSESTPSCRAVDGFLPGGFKFLGVFFCVFQPPLVLLLSLGATFGELNPPPLFFFVVLLMVFFLVVLSFLVVFLMFFNLPWCCYFPLVFLLMNRIPLSLLYCVVDGLLPSGLEFLRVLQPLLVFLLSLSVTFGELNPPFLFCCVADGLFPNGFGLPCVFLHVLELPLVLLLSLGAPLSELNPPPPSPVCCCEGDGLHLVLLNLEL